MINRIFRFLNLIILNIFILNYIGVFTSNAQIKSPKNYDEIILNVNNIDLKSATFSWEYPENMSFTMGDYLNLIIIDDEVGDNGQVPIFSVAHNMDNINLKSITSFEAKSLSSSTNYTARIELVKSNGDFYSYDTTFSTPEFEINDIGFQNIQDGTTNSKNVRLVWNISHPNIEFNAQDKIQIFMKKFSDNDFFKDPIFETKEKINRADIELPNFEELYDFKIVYTIGMKNIESEVFSLDARVNSLNFKTMDLTMNSIKLVWNFTDKNILNDDSELLIFMKEDRAIEYENEPLLKIKGKDELLKIEEYLVENLKFSTKYNLKVKFIVEVIDDLGKDVPIFTEDEYEFQTKSFALKDLKVASSSNNKCTVSWDYEGESISFSKGDSLNIYIKESSDTQYSPDVLTITENLALTKNAEITLPEYNTKYDIKINLIVGEKNVFEYITHIVEVPEVEFKIKEITDNSLKFIATFDEKIKFEDGDKIQIFAKKSTDDNYPVAVTKEVVLSSGQDTSNSMDIEFNNGDFDKVVKTSMGSDTQDKKYDFKIDVIKSGTLFQEKIYGVEMKSDGSLQIVNVSFKNKTEKEVEAVVEYAPFDFDFKDVESLSLFKEKNDDNTVKQDSGTQKEDQKIENTDGNDLKENNKFVIKFDEFGKYKLRFVYKFKETPSEAPPVVQTSSALSISELENQNFDLNSLTREQFQNGDGLSTVGEGEETDNTLQNSGDSSTSGVDDENGSSNSDQESTEPQTKPPVEKVETYNHKFDVFSLELRDVVLSEVKLNFAFAKHYTVKKGDKIEIFMKKDGNDTFSQDSIATFEHEKDKVDLNNIGVLDLVGLDYGTKYIFKAKFTAANYKDNLIEKEIEATTIDIDISDIKIEHLSDLSAVVRWKLGANFEFNPNDILNIYYKKESENEFPQRPNEIVEDIYLQDGAFIYVDYIDTKYDVKLVFESGDKTLEKQFKLNTEIEKINAEILDIYQTSAYIKWNYPKNYSITDGESVSIFVKESNQSSYGEEPDYFMEQNEEKSEFLEDFRSAKLFDLLPNTNYDVKVLLDFGEVGKKEIEISFKTEDIIVSNLKVTELKPFEFNVMWELNSNTIDFNEEYDSLDIYMKTTEEAWSDENLLYSFSKGLNNFNKVRFVVEDIKSIYDVKVDYNLVSKKISKTISTGLFYIDYDESEYGNIDVLLKYPSSIDFKDGDEVSLFLKKPKASNYEQKIVSKQSSSNDLNSLRSISLKDVQQTSSIAVYVKSKSVTVFPSEIIYDTRAENSSTLEIISELKGNWIDIELPTDYELDVTSEVRNSIGGKSYYDKLDDGTDVIVVDEIVPGKKYRETILITSDIYGNEVELFLDEFTLEPSTLLEEFLRNSYFFAFDREPDEGGYNYWKGKLEEKGDVTGKYFLVNLMFAEKEFSDRNLSDEDLIKVLYQIVVNREYDSKGLSYWIAIYGQYLTKFDGDQYEAKKTIVMRMVHEPEFERLCKQMDIKW